MCIFDYHFTIKKTWLDKCKGTHMWSNAMWCNCQWSLCTSQIEASTCPPPPPSTPEHLNFWENFCSNSPLPGPKSCSNENYRITVLTFQTSLQTTSHILHKSSLNTFKCGTKLCRPFVFNHSTTNMQSFPLNSSKFDLAIPGKSARPITWNRG